MSTELTMTIKHGFQGTYNNPDTNAGVSAGEIFSDALTNGTTADKANRYLESRNRTLTSGNSETLDLYDLGTLDIGAGAGEDALGLPLAAVELVGILIRVTSTGAGKLLVGGEGTAACFNSIFNGDDDAKAVVAAGGHFQAFNPADPAFAIADTSNHLLKLEASGGNVTFDVFLIFRDA